MRKALKLTKRVRCAIDHYVMAPLDVDQVHAAARGTDVALVSWFVPQKKLSFGVHRRYEVETFAVDDDGVEYGILTMAAGLSHPHSAVEVLDRAFGDRGGAAHGVVSFRTCVTDRTFWQRTCWNMYTHTASAAWGAAARKNYGVDVRDDPVSVRAVFDKDAGRYASYELSVPTAGLRLGLRDTGKELLHYKSPVVPGFVENESALRLLGLLPETVQTGSGGCVMRQPMWCSAINPNVAEVVDFEPGEVLLDYLKVGKEDFGEPITAWLQDEIPVQVIYTPELGVETENEPGTASTMGEERQFLTRTTFKGMKRQQQFMDDVRSKTYADIEGKEEPR